MCQVLLHLNGGVLTGRLEGIREVVRGLSARLVVFGKGSDRNVYINGIFARPGQHIINLSNLAFDPGQPMRRILTFRF